MVNPSYAERLREKAKTLPLRPGVYIMKSKSGTVIYVGKSRALKNRVSQYFHDSAKNAKTDAMTACIFDFDYILCDTEIEALTLENSLIKLYKPKYNILLKDDKSYPYLAVTSEEYPRFIMTRTRGKDARYFGPYTSAETVKNAIISLQKALGLPPCGKSFPKEIGKVQRCLYRHIGCIAVCEGNVSAEKYRELVDAGVAFLSGNADALLAKMEEKMLYAAENLMFEAAAEYRDRIKAIEKLNEKQKVVASPDTERDIIAWHAGEAASAVCVFYVRGGKLLDSESFVFSGGEILDSSAITSFLCSLYEKREYTKGNRHGRRAFRGGYRGGTGLAFRARRLPRADKNAFARRPCKALRHGRGKRGAKGKRICRRENEKRRNAYAPCFSYGA